MHFQVQAQFDVVVIGSGISGLISALELAKNGKSVFIVTKEAVTESSSLYAQGGIAVSLSPGDSFEKHLEDTFCTGGGLSDVEVATRIINFSQIALKKLISYGVKFDLDAKGNIHQTKEAAHLSPRVCHVGGDATGRFVVKALIDVACREANISISQGTVVLGIMKSEEGLISVLLEDVAKNKYVVNAAHVIIATGGVGQLFSTTTNPLVSTGDGISMAYRMGAKLRDLEFIQFHPTVCIENGDPFLITEAIRGEGGKLKNLNGEYFAYKYHQEGELAPRDILARGIYKELQKNGSKYVYLDISNFEADYFEKRFPTVFKECIERKINLFSKGIPVVPAAHYFIGGIKSDIECKTNIPSVWAVGECSSNGFHGANRLASNSLLECIVMPHFLAESLLNDERSVPLPQVDYVDFPVNEDYIEEHEISNLKKELQERNSLSLGLIRDGVSLKEHVGWLDTLIQKYDAFSLSLYSNVSEIRNMIMLSYLISYAALQRDYSIGVHFREDFQFPADTSVFRHSITKMQGSCPVYEKEGKTGEMLTFLG